MIIIFKKMRFRVLIFLFFKAASNYPSLKKLEPFEHYKIILIIFLFFTYFLTFCRVWTLKSSNLKKLELFEPYKIIIIFFSTHLNIIVRLEI